MRTRILSLVVTFIALLAFNNAFAQNPHFNSNETQSVTVTCEEQGSSTVYLVTISGTVHGIGNARTGTITYTYDAEFNCYNRGADAGPVPGQSGPVSGVVKNVTLTTIKPGVATYNATFTIGASCKGKSLYSVVTDLDFSALNLVIQGESLSLLDYIGAIPNCEEE
ncbi:hypothetical protein H7F15_16990 [Pontibacter sp. Tf4]|uniref:hypothetical protein n=1 Tax=Pontibacter sp. Tf4 TaxID=2761620 RepID=UPI001625565A|nr:hypothetical protein [Pontibacter sp. Tf4]MBB6612741.1 hypothetical protein [Pontibacter sp. Tf4]